MGLINVMRMKLFFASIWLVSILCINAQEVPPAFEKGDGAAPTEEGTFEDPFDPATDAPKLIRVQVEFIEVSHKDLTRLMMEDKSETSDATALRMEVQKMADQDKAKILDTQMVIGRSGQKSTSESHTDFIYPTEYEPGVIDAKIIEEMRKRGSFPAYPGSPTAFETRHLGSNLESEPTVGEDGDKVDLRVLPSIVWHTGNAVWNESKDALGNVTKVSMPEIYSIEINTSLACVSGQYCLLGVTSPYDKDGRMDTERKVMVFVKCDVMSVIP